MIFFLGNLSAKVWKRLHMMIYFAYAQIIAHVFLGAFQQETSLFTIGIIIIIIIIVIVIIIIIIVIVIVIVIIIIIIIDFITVPSLHLITAFKERKIDRTITIE
jgi:sulfoxide reductase heme-binding subunit YedZ